MGSYMGNGIYFFPAETDPEKIKAAVEKHAAWYASFMSETEGMSETA
ncbi:MAG: hypothetical protein ACQET8_17255 [Bacillota bacterium]